MSAAKVLLPGPGVEGGPLGRGDPMHAREVGCGDDAFCLEHLGEGFNPGEKRADGLAGVEVRIEGDYGEHLAADGFVADPKDEIVAELDGFDDMRKRAEERTGGRDVHACECRAAA